MKRVILLVLGITAFVSSYGQVEVRNIDSQMNTNGHAVYILPKKKLVIAAVAECTIEKPGPFAQYAKRYLAVDNAIMSESRRWSLVRVEVEEQSVDDSTKMFAVIGKGELEYAKEKKPKRVAKLIQTTDTTIHFGMECLGEEALVSTSIPKMAELAAKQIYQIRESRMALLTGDVNHQPDGKALQIMMDRLDRQEEELVALFVGKTVKFRDMRKFEIDADGDLSNYVAGRISTVEGLKEADEMIGTPIFVNIEAHKVVMPSLKKEPKKKGYRVNVCGTAIVTVACGDVTEKVTVKMPQFGYVKWLGTEIDEVVLNPETGELVKYSD